MTTQQPLALVTGASSGIGAEIAVELAKRAHDLILCGRNPQRLDEVAIRCRQAGATVQTVILDLANRTETEELATQFATSPIDVLVNNAGFGWSGEFADMAPSNLEAMIQLNITSLSVLTRTFVTGMIERRHGRLLNVASTAAFSPCPTMAVYAATKAFVLSFSEALATELQSSGVTVTALCPGATKTRFAEVATINEQAFSHGAMEAQKVAQLGVQALLSGKRSIVTGLNNALMAFSTRLAPRSVSAGIAGMILKKF